MEGVDGRLHSARGRHHLASIEGAVAGFLTCLALFAAALPARAATVTAFASLREGATLTLTNHQAAVVTGTIRLLPETGRAAPAGVPFTLAAGASQAFPGIAGTLGNPKLPAIIAIDATDVIMVDDGVIPVAHTTRPTTVAVRYNPADPTAGVLLVAPLPAQVRVNIYEHRESTIPLATRTVSASIESVERLTYAALIPPGVRLYDGWASIEPVSGQAVAFAVNPAPGRRRTVRHPGAERPDLSVAGTQPCEFSSGYSATTPGLNSASYNWSLFNATVAGTPSNSVGFVLGTAGYATIALRETDARGITGFAEVNVKIQGKITVSGLVASDAVVGDEVRITWTKVPGSGLLYGTDFPATGLRIDLSLGSHTYRADEAGSKQISVVPESACGSQGATVAYVVSPSCSAPSANVSGPSSVTAGSTFTASMPSGASSYSWEAVSGSSLKSGQGTRIATFLVTAEAGGSARVRGTASNGSGCTASDIATVAVTYPPPTITNLSVDPSTIGFFPSCSNVSPECATTVVSFTTTNTTSWEATTLSSLNSWGDDFENYLLGDHQLFLFDDGSGRTRWSGTGDGTHSKKLLGFLPCRDTVVVTATGPGGTTEVSVPLRINGCVIAFHREDFASGSDMITVPLGTAVTLRFSYVAPDASTLTATSSLGNAITPASRPAGQNYGVYSFTYTRTTGGDDTVTITSSTCGATRQVVVK